MIGSLAKPSMPTPGEIGHHKIWYNYKTLKLCAGQNLCDMHHVIVVIVHITQNILLLSAFRHVHSTVVRPF